MKKSCQYCGKIHPYGYSCKVKPRRVRHKISKQDLFRSTNKWTEKSLEIKERDLFLCRVCLENGVIEWNSLEVHHIIPLLENFDLCLENDNLITLCYKHHREAEHAKISRERLFELAKTSPRGYKYEKGEVCTRPHSPIHVQNFPEMTEKGEIVSGKTGKSDENNV